GPFAAPAAVCAPTLHRAALEERAAVGFGDFDVDRVGERRRDDLGDAPTFHRAALQPRACEEPVGLDLRRAGDAAHSLDARLRHVFSVAEDLPGAPALHGAVFHSRAGEGAAEGELHRAVEIAHTDRTGRDVPAASDLAVAVA